MFSRNIVLRTLLILTVTVLVFSGIRIFGPFQKSLQLAERLQKEVDSLQIVAQEYRRLESRYNKIYFQFLEVDSGLKDFEKNISSKLSNRSIQAEKIRQALYELRLGLDSLNIRSTEDTLNLDSLFF